MRKFLLGFLLGALSVAIGANVFDWYINECAGQALPTRMHMSYPAGHGPK